MFRMVLANELDANDPFTITFFDIEVPTQTTASVIYSYFTIEGYYDGNQISETLIPQELTITSVADAFYLGEIDFYPRNEAEYATYVFNVEMN